MLLIIISRDGSNSSFQKCYPDAVLRATWCGRLWGVRRVVWPRLAFLAGSQGDGPTATTSSSSSSSSLSWCTLFCFVSFVVFLRMGRERLLGVGVGGRGVG